MVVPLACASLRNTAKHGVGVSSIPTDEQRSPGYSLVACPRVICLRPICTDRGRTCRRVGPRFHAVSPSMLPLGLPRVLPAGWSRYSCALGCCTPRSSCLRADWMPFWPLLGTSRSLATSRSAVLVIKQVPPCCAIPQVPTAVSPRTPALTCCHIRYAVLQIPIAVSPQVSPTHQACPGLLHDVRGGFAAIRGAQPHPPHAHVAAHCLRRTTPHASAAPSAAAPPGPCCPSPLWQRALLPLPCAGWSALTAATVGSPPAAPHACCGAPQGPTSPLPARGSAPPRLCVQPASLAPCLQRPALVSSPLGPLSVLRDRLGD